MFNLNSSTVHRWCIARHRRTLHIAGAGFPTPEFRRPSAAPLSQTPVVTKELVWTEISPAKSQTQQAIAPGQNPSRAVHTWNRLFLLAG
jgi:hypothetical protein